jgi:hypothetical protein
MPTHDVDGCRLMCRTTCDRRARAGASATPSPKRSESLGSTYCCASRECAPWRRHTPPAETVRAAASTRERAPAAALDSCRCPGRPRRAANPTLRAARGPTPATIPHRSVSALGTCADRSSGGAPLSVLRECSDRNAHRMRLNFQRRDCRSHARSGTRAGDYARGGTPGTAPNDVASDRVRTRPRTFAALSAPCRSGVRTGPKRRSTSCPHSDAARDSAVGNRLSPTAMRWSGRAWTDRVADQSPPAAQRRAFSMWFRKWGSPQLGSVWPRAV